MEIIPAIDIKNGNVVRLLRGDYQQVTLYSADPADMARRWYSQGANMLHVVDLDGALLGEPKNMDSVFMIVKAVSIPVELGGGIRSLELIRWAFNVGVSKVVIGTKVAEDLEFVSTAIKTYGDRVVVSIDAKNGFVMMQGWTKTSTINAIDMARQMEHLGAASIIYTDVTVDGTLAGPNLTRLDNFLSNVSIPVVVAGGISCTDDIRNLSALKRKNLAGVIVGKALYEGNVNLKEAITACLPSE